MKITIKYKANPGTILGDKGELKCKGDKQVVIYLLQKALEFAESHGFNAELKG